MNYKKRYQTQLSKYNRLKEMYKSALAEKEMVERKYSESLKTLDILNAELFDVRSELKDVVSSVRNKNDECGALNKRVGKVLKDIEREFYKRYKTMEG